LDFSGFGAKKKACTNGNLERKYHKTVLGVIPYMKNLGRMRSSKNTARYYLSIVQ